MLVALNSTARVYSREKDSFFFDTLEHQACGTLAALACMDATLKGKFNLEENFLQHADARIGLMTSTITFSHTYLRPTSRRSPPSSPGMTSISS